MARVCDICGRGTIATATRSHSQIQTKKKSYINLQSKKIDGQRKKVCTSCLKTMAKTK